MINILYVRDGGCNAPYLKKTLRLVGNADVTVIGLEKYLITKDTDYDVVIYQTSPAEYKIEDPTQYAKKFRASIICQTDDKFLNNNRRNILFDAHDDGNTNAFSRLGDIDLPRIKNAPHKKYLSRWPVLMRTTYYVPKQRYKIYNHRRIDVSYCCTLKTHPIRKRIKKQLKGLRYYIDTKKHPMRKYRRRLMKTKITVCPPGYGNGTIRHLESLHSGTLAFYHENIRNIDLLPHSNLIENEHYVTFTEDTLIQKLEEFIQNDKERTRISLAGKEAFSEGYSYTKSALEFNDMLKKMG